jgi:hypothetical protein
MRSVEGQEARILRLRDSRPFLFLFRLMQDSVKV